MKNDEIFQKFSKRMIFQEFSCFLACVVSLGLPTCRFIVLWGSINMVEIVKEKEEKKYIKKRTKRKECIRVFMENTDFRPYG
jgi:hypothetical protein